MDIDFLPFDIGKTNQDGPFRPMAKFNALPSDPADSPLLARRVVAVANIETG